MIRTGGMDGAIQSPGTMDEVDRLFFGKEPMFMRVFTPERGSGDDFKTGSWPGV